MSAADLTAGILVAPDLTAKRSWRSVKSAMMTGLMVASVIAVAVPLVAVVWAVFARGLRVAIHGFPAFFVAEIPVIARRPGPGMGPAILGTLLATGAATLISVPLGVAGAVYLHEYGVANRFSRLVRFMANVMTGVPSIVMGLFVYVTWTLRFGYSAFGGALALACLMLPVVIGATEQMLKLVPNHLREASYAVGKTKIATVRRILLPTARPQVATGAMLGLGRIIGDTAIIVVLLGATQNFAPVGSTFPLNYLRGAGTTLTNFVYEASPTGNLNQPQKAYAAAFVLLLMVLALNAAVDVVHRRARKVGTWSS